MKSTTHSLLSPAQVVVIAMLSTILAGAILLSLPISRIQEISFLDLLFTATSATCVTGLFSIPLEGFSLFGQFILWALVQIGGLGLITITLVVVYSLMDLRLSTQLMAGEVYEINAWQDLRNILIFTIASTALFELIGAFLTFFCLSNEIPLYHRLLLSLFHATSAFCNAGIMLPHMPQLQSCVPLLFITMILVYCGGIGFATMYETIRHFLARWHKQWHRLSLNTTIIIYGSTSLILASTIIISIIERNHAFAHVSLLWNFIYSLFHAISFKSTGFLLAPITTFQLATLFIMMLISFIGSAPGSTGSGVKITTMAIYIAAIKAAFLNRVHADICKRQIPTDLVLKAVAIIAISASWILATTLCLLITEQSSNFFSLFMTSTTAFTTLGVSIGSPALLSPFGKCFIIISMLVGRIGSYTVILAIRLARHHRDMHAFSYPEERVMLG